MALLKKRFAGRSDEQLAEEIEELKQRRRAYAREHGNRLKEDAHAAVDRSIAEARERLEAALAAHAGPGGGLSLLRTRVPGTVSLVELVPLWTLSRDPELVKLLHAAVDAAGTFSPVSRPAFERELAKLDGEVHARELEIERRAGERKLQEAQAEAAALQERLASIEKA